jgi:hypothetical protein
MPKWDCVSPHSEPPRDAIANVRAAVRLRDEGKSYEQAGKELGKTGMAHNKLVRRWTQWVHERRMPPWQQPVE